MVAACCTTGVLSAISSSPQFLVEALAIGSTLRLIEGISPGMAVDQSSGNFCVLMPCRCVAEGAPEVGADQAAQAIAAEIAA